jgi:fumarylacetoacetate (FAA) hydrolase
VKLATLRDGTRDGRLAVVSRDLTRMLDASAIARTLQVAIEDWERVSPLLADRYAALNDDAAGAGRHALAFDPARCHAPLPRAYQWADGSAYVNHVELVRRARGAEMPQSFWTDPLMYQGGSDSFLGPCDDVPFADEAWGIDFEGEVAVITSDVPLGTPAAAAGAHILLFMLVNDWSLRNLIPGELGKGFGFVQSKPASSFSPVAVTADELGDAWQDGRVHLPLIAHLNGALFGRPNAGLDMTFNFAQLIAHLARTRELEAGSIVGSGTVSNKENGAPGRPARDGGAGYACVAEQRTIETILGGKPVTPFMRFGERVRIEMLDTSGQSIFGAIDQRVIRSVSSADTLPTQTSPEK